MATSTVDDDFSSYLDSLSRVGSDPSTISQFEVIEDPDSYLGSMIEAAPERSVSAIKSGKPEVRQSMSATPSGPADIIPGIGRGLMDVVDTGAKILQTPFYDEESEKELDRKREERRQQFESEYGESGYATAGRIGGNILATAPPIMGAARVLGAIPKVGAAITGANATTKIGRAVAGATGGAAGGIAGNELVSEGYGREFGEDAVLSGVLGAAIGPLAPAAIGGAKRAVGAIGDVGSTVAGAALRGVESVRGRNPLVNPPLSSAGLDPDVANALTRQRIDTTTLPTQAVRIAEAEKAAQIAVNGVADVDAVARRANFAALDIDPTTSMVTRDYTTWAKTIEKAKTPEGAALYAKIRAANDKLRTALLGEADKTRGVITDSYDAGKSAIDAVRTKFDEVDAQVGLTYKTIRETEGDLGGIKVENLEKALDLMSDSSDAIPLVDSVRRRLARYGVGPEGGTLTIAQAEELRKFIGQNRGNYVFIKEIKNAIDDDVIDKFGDDVFGVARKAHSEQMKAIERSKVLEAALNKDPNPQTFVDNFVIGRGGSPEDIAALKDYLISGNPLQRTRGEQAWNDIRRRVATYINEAATSRNVDEADISWPKMRDAIERIGKDKMVILFGEESAGRYQQILKAAHDVNFPPPATPINTSNTANEVLQRIQDLAKTGGNIVGVASSGVTGAVATATGAMLQRGAEKASKKAAKQEIDNLLLGTAAVPREGAKALPAPAAVPGPYRPPAGSRTTTRAGTDYSVNYLLSDDRK